MLRISGIRAGLDEDTTEYLRMAAAKTLHVPPERIAALTIVKKSVDARKKHDVYFVYSVDVMLTDGDRIPPRADKARVPAWYSGRVYSSNGAEKAAKPSCRLRFWPGGDVLRAPAGTRGPCANCA